MAIHDILCYVFAAETLLCCFFFQAEDGIRDLTVTGVQTCALPISTRRQHNEGPHTPAKGSELIVADRAAESTAPGPDRRTRSSQRHRAPWDQQRGIDRKSTRLNSSHSQISYAVFCLKKKKRDHGDHPKDKYHNQYGGYSELQKTKFESSRQNILGQNLRHYQILQIQNDYER